ncbi:MAG: hypothetical protein HZC38_05165 [Chloroflexi bacterium]|nr:hypothetical protein [Chloroflexota bacterium]MBI5712799.1 hypothetical protein [Chloroflexota bacterium]
MIYRLVFTDWFNRQIKQLRKDNPSLRSDLDAFFKTFDAQAHPIIPQTNGARKARMKAKARGKRSGYRVIYYFITDENEVWLITIYDKVKQENLSSDESSRVAKIIREIKEKQKTEGNGK